MSYSRVASRNLFSVESEYELQIPNTKNILSNVRALDRPRKILIFDLIKK